MVFLNDDDAEVYGTIIVYEYLDYIVVNINRIPIEMIADKSLSGYVPVKKCDGTTEMRYYQFFASGSEYQKNQHKDLKACFY